MMMLNTQISIISIAGIVGIIDYWFLSYTDYIVFFDTNKSDEKITFITLLGFFNLLMYKFLSSYIDNIICLIVIMFIISFVFMLAILWIVQKLISRFNSLLKQYGKTYKRVGEDFDRYIYDVYSNDKKIQNVYVYILDFENKLIDKGYLNKYQPHDGYFNFSMVLALDNDYSLEKKFDLNILDNASEVFIDFNYKIKIYVLPVYLE